MTIFCVVFLLLTIKFHYLFLWNIFDLYLLALFNFQFKIFSKTNFDIYFPTDLPCIWAVLQNKKKIFVCIGAMKDVIRNAEVNTVFCEKSLEKKAKKYFQNAVIEKTSYDFIKVSIFTLSISIHEFEVCHTYLILRISLLFRTIPRSRYQINQ